MGNHNVICKWPLIWVVVLIRCIKNIPSVSIWEKYFWMSYDESSLSDHSIYINMNLGGILTKSLDNPMIAMSFIDFFQMHHSSEHWPQYLVPFRPYIPVAVWINGKLTRPRTCCCEVIWNFQVHFSGQCLKYILWWVRWLSQDFVDHKSTLDQIMVWYLEAPSHCLKQYWTNSIIPNQAITWMNNDQNIWCQIVSPGTNESIIGQVTCPHRRLSIQIGSSLNLN